ncbi:Phosphatidylinositol-4-phosphate 5-kinase [Phytophthora cinnamomi]|uniref:Phosphatidylinositol-4-phosphate 5-kinase n=1 Tax=Phytophthora cinnamomi TaxID=4785 RepID=UPI00355A51AD|nr:Phosphatidylinositol-4-phosphate 5-kinase [Phytophthora cinnamomi]
MGNRGRRRGTRAAYQTDATAAAGCSKKQEPTPQSESDESPGPEDRSPEIVSIRWKKPRGAVVIQYADGSRYEGGVDEEERKHGTGVHILRSGHIFEGGWVHGDFEGFGMQTFAGTGDCHEGMYRKNHRHGTGTYLWANGDKYVGNWRVGKMHGNGTFFWKNGDSYDGEWKKGVMHGKGKKIFSSGEMIDGSWRHNQVSEKDLASMSGWAETRMKARGAKV